MGLVFKVWQIEANRGKLRILPKNYHREFLQKQLLAKSHIEVIKRSPRPSFFVVRGKPEEFYL